MEQALQEFKRVEANTRHDLAIFLILGSLVFIDISGINDEKQREKMTGTWVSWGVVFVLLGFFILVPERDAQQTAALRNKEML